MFASLRLIIMIAGVAAPFLGYGWGRVNGYVAQRHAVAEARVDEQKRCHAQIESISSQIKRSADDRVKAAEDAAAKAPTPTTAAELVALCKKSASCRDQIVSGREKTR